MFHLHVKQTSVFTLKENWTKLTYTESINTAQSKCFEVGGKMCSIASKMLTKSIQFPVFCMKSPFRRRPETSFR